MTNGDENVYRCRYRQSLIAGLAGNLGCYLALALVVVFASLAWADEPPPPPSGCGKNISFAIAEHGQPVPAIPKFALKWLGSKSRRDHFSDLCFSQIPSINVANYIVVFSTTEAAFEGLAATAHTYTSAAPDREGSETFNGYGGTWSYAYTGVVPPQTTNTLDLKRDDKPKQLDVRAFDQSGKTVSRHSLSTSSSREKLLEQVLADILGDKQQFASKKPFLSPLSVYYINCDVDGPPGKPGGESTPTEVAALQHTDQSTPGAHGEGTAKPLPPPDPELDIWSNPPGADIFLDGGYVGTTPTTLSVHVGEHTVSLRKKNFAIWQRRISVTPGKRKVAAYLEQKILNLQ